MPEAFAKAGIPPAFVSAKLNWSYLAAGNCLIVFQVSLFKLAFIIFYFTVFHSAQGRFVVKDPWLANTGSSSVWPVWAQLLDLNNIRGRFSCVPG
jgi:hypothetical protein